MKANKRISTGLLALTLTSGALMNHTNAFSFDRDFSDRSDRAAFHQQMQTFRDQMSHESETLTNGVKITFTGSTAEAIAHLQERATEKSEKERQNPRNESIEKKVTLTDTGYIMTLTSTDADVVEKIQNRPEPGERKDRRGAHKKPMMENVERTTTQLTNGVQMKVTTQDPDVLAELHEHADHMNEREPKNEAITKSITKTADGFIVTITADDADTIKKIQTQSDKGSRSNANHRERKQKKGRN